MQKIEEDTFQLVGDIALKVGTTRKEATRENKAITECTKTFTQDPLFLMCLPYIKSLLLMQIGPFMISDLLKWVLVSIVQFVICKQFYLAAYRALRNRSTNMDVFALGTSASYFYSVCSLLYGAITGFSSPTYFETSAKLITFVLFGKYLEVVAKGKTSDAIKKLLELVPAT